ncbi:MAG: hypothetical protein ACI8RZ_003291 [Myxococcota bacterium]|jgi:hypothetical protein
MTIILISGLIGCGTQQGWPTGSGGSNYSGGSSGTPSDRPHTIKESDDGLTGYHAVGYETPFLCLDAGGSSVTCPDDAWPERSELSCDASGCHGSYTYDPADTQRDLNGSGAPGCYTCHDKEWSSAKTTAEAAQQGGDEDEEDDD